MKTKIPLWWVVAGLVLSSSTRMEGNNVIVEGTVTSPNTVTATTASVSLFVDPLGNDNNACTSAGASACLTPQGAINKVPKYLRHGAVVKLAPGNYPGFIVSGFQNDSIQTSTAGLAIEGTLSNSTLATGTATGTATAVTAGSTDTHGTLTDSGQAWTVDDLKGRFVTITSGTGAGQIRVISSNTATTLTIAGAWGTTAPLATSGYAIQDATSVINTCTSMPPVPNQPGSTTLTAAARFAGNATGTAINVRFLKISAACTFGLYQAEGATLLAHRLQFTSTAGSASRIAFNGSMFVDSIYSIYSGTTGTHITGGGIVGTSATGAANVAGIASPTNNNFGGGTIQNSMLVNGGTGVNFFAARCNIFGMNVQNVASVGFSIPGSQNFQGLIISCNGGASSNAVLVQGISGAPAGGSVTPDHLTVSNCGIGLKATGPGAHVWTSNGITATNVTTGMLVNRGALVSFDSGDGMWAATGTEISLDDGKTTGTYAAIASGECLVQTHWGSRVCRD